MHSRIVSTCVLKTLPHEGCLLTSAKEAAKTVSTTCNFYLNIKFLISWCCVGACKCQAVFRQSHKKPTAKGFSPVDQEEEDDVETGDNENEEETGDDDDDEEIE